MRGRLIAAVAAVLLLAGCSGVPTATEDPAPSPTGVATSEAPIPTPTESTNSEAEVALIISGPKDGFLSTADKMEECIGLYEDFLDLDEVGLVNLRGCFVIQTIAVDAAKETADELRAITPPAHLKLLVDDTILTFDMIVAIDLPGRCGGVESGPKFTESCEIAFRSMENAYPGLLELLDKWHPYL